MKADKAKIVLLPGDGIGPEVVGSAVSVLKQAAQIYDIELDYKSCLIGGAAIDENGTPLPQNTIDDCTTADAILLGAVGGPAWDSIDSSLRPEQGLLGIRARLGVFANIRPIKPHPELTHASPLKQETLSGTDMLIVRELTGGIYFGEKPRITDEHGNTSANDICTYSASEIERIVRTAGNFARTRKKRLASVDKANILETSRLWRETTERIMKTEFPDVQLEHILVDTCAMRLVLNPSHFDVVVTENMFGDILTDEAAVITGSIGLLPSASLGRKTEDGRHLGLYEPIHGSAPDIAGKGIANPMGTILSVALMLRWSLGHEQAAQSIEQAVSATVSAGVVTPDLNHGSKYTSDMVTRKVIELLS